MATGLLGPKCRRILYFWLVRITGRRSITESAPAGYQAPGYYTGYHGSHRTGSHRIAPLTRVVNTLINTESSHSGRVPHLFVRPSGRHHENDKDPWKGMEAGRGQAAQRARGKEHPTRVISSKLQRTPAAVQGAMWLRTGRLVPSRWEATLSTHRLTTTVSAASPRAGFWPDLAFAK